MEIYFWRVNILQAIVPFSKSVIDPYCATPGGFPVLTQVFIFVGSMECCAVKQDESEDDDVTQAMKDSSEELQVEKSLEELKNPKPKVWSELSHFHLSFVAIFRVLPVLEKRIKRTLETCKSTQPMKEKLEDHKLKVWCLLKFFHNLLCVPMQYLECW